MEAVKPFGVEGRDFWNDGFTPNWIWRAVVEVAVTTPAVGEIPDVAEEYTTGFGVRKLVCATLYTLSFSAQRRFSR